MYLTISAALGYVGMAFGILAYQSNKHKSILYMKIISEFSFAVQYFMLGAIPGAVMNILGVIRNYFLSRDISSRKKRIGLTILFILIMTIACLLTWNGSLTLLALLGKSCTTVSYSIKNTKWLRLVTIPSCILWLIYDLAYQSMGGVIYEVFGLVSILAAWIRFDVINKKREVAVSAQSQA